MKIEINATGAPMDVQQTLAHQVKRSRTEHPAFSATLASLSDDLQKAAHASPGATGVEVKAELIITVTHTAPRPVTERRVVADVAGVNDPSGGVTIVDSPTIVRKP